MPDPVLRHLAVTPGRPDEQIAALVRDFQEAPHDFSCEQELHAHFYSLGRNAYPTKYPTTDRNHVTAFRYQYATIWRYTSGDRFTQRQHNSGSTATFDFAVLQKHFIENSDYLTVMNKDEQRRAKIRPPQKLETYYGWSPVQAAIEIKMAAFLKAMEVTEGDINRLEDRMLTACRKLAQERIRQSYVVGISHGPLPDLPRAQAMIATCLQLHRARYPDGSLSVLVATPTQTILGGDWAEDVEFPKVASQGGWPVSRNEDIRSEPGPGPDSVQ